MWQNALCNVEMQCDEERAIVGEMFGVEWAALSARIAALIDACNLLVRSGVAGEADTYNMGGEMHRNARQIVGYLKRLQERHSDELPDAAGQCLYDSLERIEQRFPPDSGGTPAFVGAVTLLASFRAEFTHLLTDSEAVARSLVARAFSHLQRSIVADEVVRSRWKAAFEKDEPACEALGACHFLTHGI
jgi:hypothetical protein